MAGLVIAERVFQVDGQDTLCRFFQPEADGGDLLCCYDIAWPEGRKNGRAFGVDTAQALLLAMERAHTDLLAARENHGRQVIWLDQKSLGLPTTDIGWHSNGDWVRTGS